MRVSGTSDSGGLMSTFATAMVSLSLVFMASVANGCPAGKEPDGFVLDTATIQGSQVLAPINPRGFVLVEKRNGMKVNGWDWQGDGNIGVFEIPGQPASEIFVSASLVYLDKPEFERDRTLGRQFSPLILAKSPHALVVGMFDQQMRAPPNGVGRRAIDLTILRQFCK